MLTESQKKLNAALIHAGNGQYDPSKHVGLFDGDTPVGRLLTEDELALIDAQVCRNAHADGMLLVWWIEQQSVGMLDLMEDGVTAQGFEVHYPEAAEDSK